MELDWYLDPVGLQDLSQRFKSIFTMIYGVKLNNDKLAGRNDVSASAIEFFPAMMLLPFETEKRGKKPPPMVKFMMK